MNDRSIANANAGTGDDHLQSDGPQDEHDQRRRGGGWAGWLISISFHSLLIGVMSGIYYLIAPPATDPLPVRTTMIEPPPKKEEKRERAPLEQPEVQIVVESEAIAPVTILDLPIDVPAIEDPTQDTAPQGREDAVADVELGSTGVFMAIGAGTSGSGMYGKRKGGGKIRAIGERGGSRGSEAAVGGALRWLKRHQGPNGSWDSVTYTKNCSDDLKCEPGTYANVGDTETTMAMTGYAVLCFLGAGYDHQSPNKYQTVVKKGLDYIVSAQKADGSLGTHNYQNAVATMALAEAYGMTGDPALKSPAQQGVNTILARQNQDMAKGAGDDKTKDPYGGFGWDYSGPNARSDSSVSGWNVMALKSALASQLDVGNGLEGAKQWLEKVWKANNPDWAKLDPYKGESVFPYQYARIRPMAAPPDIRRSRASVRCARYSSASTPEIRCSRR